MDDKMRFAGEDSRETNQTTKGNRQERSIKFAGMDAADDFGAVEIARVQPHIRPAPRADSKRAGPVYSAVQEHGTAVPRGEHQNALTATAPEMGIAMGTADAHRAERQRQRAAARPGELDNRRELQPNLQYASHGPPPNEDRGVPHTFIGRDTADHNPIGDGTKYGTYVTENKSFQHGDGDSSSYNRNNWENVMDGKMKYAGEDARESSTQVIQNRKLRNFRFNEADKSLSSALPEPRYTPPPSQLETAGNGPEMHQHAVALRVYGGDTAAARACARPPPAAAAARPRRCRAHRLAASTRKPTPRARGARRRWAMRWWRRSGSQRARQWARALR